MKELVSILGTVYYLNLGATATIAALLLSKYKKSYAKYFCYFLIYVFFMEVIASYPSLLFKYYNSMILNNKFLDNNFWYYTLFWHIGSGCFYTFYFQKTLKIKFFKSILKYGRYLFVLFSFVVISQNYNEFFTRSFSTISFFNTVLVVCCVVFFFIEVLSTNIILSFNKNINFYIVSSILIWWLVTIPLSLYSGYYTTHDMEFVYLNRVLMASSNIFMYTCFAIGLIVSKPQLKND